MQIGGISKKPLLTARRAKNPDNEARNGPSLSRKTVPFRLAWSNYGFFGRAGSKMGTAPYCVSNPDRPNNCKMFVSLLLFHCLLVGVCPPKLLLIRKYQEGLWKNPSDNRTLLPSWYFRIQSTRPFSSAWCAFGVFSRTYYLAVSPFLFCIID